MKIQNRVVFTFSNDCTYCIEFHENEREFHILDEDENSLAMVIPEKDMTDFICMLSDFNHEQQGH